MRITTRTTAFLLALILLFGGITPAFNTQAAMPASTENQGNTQAVLKDVRKAPAVSGSWIKKGSRYAFRKKDGTNAKAEWLKISNKIYYFKENGYRTTGWHKYHGKKYFFNEKGQMVTGWLKSRSNTKVKYYLKKNGTLAQKEWIKSGKKYYFLKSDGKMARGWLNLAGKRYYLDDKGVRVTGEYFIKGKGCYFDQNGVYNKNKKVTGRGINPTKPLIALTFDDGPGPYTDRLLRCLKKNNAVATFFVVGSNVGRYKSTVKKADQMGCEIGNHSWDHPSLSSLSAGSISAQLRSTDRAVKAATGKNTTLLRPPYGAYNSTVAMTAGKPIILWDVDTLDWKTRNSQSTINSVTGSSSDGSIVLMHDIHLPTVVAVETIVPRLIKKGYQLVTVSELAKYKKVKLRSGVAYRSIK